MGKATDLYGVASIEVGEPGDGVMGASLTSFTDIKEGSVSINIEKPSTEKVYTETNRKTPYRTFCGGQSSITFDFGLFGLTLEQLVMFLGGSYDSTNEQWIAPSESQDIYKSVKITQRDTDTDKRLVHYIPYGAITAGIEGNLTYNSLANLSITVEANLPVADDGTEGNPYYMALETDAE